MTGERRSDRYCAELTDEAYNDAQAMHTAADRLAVDPGRHGLWVDESVAMPLSETLYCASRELVNGRALPRRLWTALRTLADALQPDQADQPKRRQ